MKYPTENTVINIVNYGSKQSMTSWSLRAVKLEFPVTSRRNAARAVLENGVLKLENTPSRSGGKPEMTGAVLYPRAGLVLLV